MSNKKFTPYEISEEFYNLFFDVRSRLDVIDYLDNSYSDEGIEIDLNTNKVNILFHVINKYAIPQYNGTYSDLFEFVRDNIIHPSDVHIFDDLMNPKTVLEKLKESKFPNFRFAHFRYKLIDGSYRWVEQVVIAGEENGIKPGVLKSYIFDIQNLKVRETGEEGDESYVFEKFHDENTGLLLNGAFFLEAQKIVEKNKNKWCLLSIDIEHFKLFDEWNGRQAGDYLLKRIATDINKFVEVNDGLAGYLGQDDFIVLTPFNHKKIRDLFSMLKETINSFGFTSGFMPAIGVAHYENGEKLETCFDKATIAGAKAKKNKKERIYVYNPKLHLENEEQYHILEEFMKALQNDEITFYLQPQCRISTKKIVGAEALARWVKEDGTVISPAVFIPILEKFGFITDMDQYVWDKVCKWIRSCYDKNIQMVPISVNISQIDIFNIDIAEHFTKLIKKYNIPASSIKIEITESAYAETMSTISELVSKLRNAGFMVMMDDFGSGYSSLNMLSSLDVDTVKLDSQFMNSADSGKGVHIVESIINMTKIIGLPIVVEGVENAHQLKWLIDLGCRYVQGYYFYKPMPISEFEQLITQEDILDLRGIVVKANDQFKIREFLDESIFSDAMLNNIIGAVAYYSVIYDNIDIIRYNQQFYESVGVPDFAERLESIQRFVPDEDKPALYKCLEEARINKLNGATCLTHFYRSNGTLMAYMMHFYYLGYQDGAHRYYGSANNITELMDLQEEMSLIDQYGSNTIIFVKKISDKWSFRVGSNGLGRSFGISKEGLSDILNKGRFDKLFSDEDFSHIREVIYDSLNNKKTNSIVFNFLDQNKKDVRLMLRINPVEKNISNVEYIVTIWRYGH